MLAVLGGHVHFTTENVSEAYASIEAKKLRILGMTTEKRLVQFPDVPTLTELGTKVQVGTGRGFAMPAGVPEEAAAFDGSRVEESPRQQGAGRNSPARMCSRTAGWAARSSARTS